MVTSSCESKVVFPMIKLGDKNNTVTFSYQGWYLGDITKEVGLAVREQDGEWIDIPIAYPKPIEYSVFNVGELPVPDALNGKNVQFAYKYYVTTTENIGYWFIQDFHLNGIQNEAPVEKAEADISYDETEVTYVIGDSDFKAPVLNNPYNLQAYYSSENESVAIINEDGSFDIVGSGKALIRALILETDEFKKGEASYTLTVIDPEIVFAAEFDKDKCGFYEEGEQDVAWTYF